MLANNILLKCFLNLMRPRATNKNVKAISAVRVWLSSKQYMFPNISAYSNKRHLGF